MRRIKDRSGKDGHDSRSWTLSWRRSCSDMMLRTVAVPIVWTWVLISQVAFWLRSGCWSKTAITVPVSLTPKVTERFRVLGGIFSWWSRALLRIPCMKSMKLFSTLDFLPQCKLYMLCMLPVHRETLSLVLEYWQRHPASTCVPKNRV